MDIDKFIDDNIEEILDNPTFFISPEQITKENKNIVNKNIYEDEDLEEQDDIIDLQDVHEMLEKRKEAIKNKENPSKENINEDPEDPEYYFKFINTYMKYYNNKYNKNENLFSNITDKLDIEQIDLLDKYYDSDSKEIINLMNSYEQVYCLEINEDNKKIITISLIICLNYILVNKIEKWNIFMLKSY